MAYMTIKKKGAAIRAELKKLGYNARQVSVKTGYCGYSDFARIRIKDCAVNKKAVENACKKFSSIRYDEFTGEILEGANTYIDVDYDFEALENAIEKAMPEVESVVSEIAKEQKHIKKGKEEYVIYKEDDGYYMACCSDYPFYGMKIKSWDLDSFKYSLAKVFVTEGFFN